MNAKLPRGGHLFIGRNERLIDRRFWYKATLRHGRYRFQHYAIGNLSVCFGFYKGGKCMGVRREVVESLQEDYRQLRAEFDAAWANGRLEWRGDVLVTVDREGREIR